MVLFCIQVVIVLKSLGVRFSPTYRIHHEEDDDDLTIRKQSINLSTPLQTPSKKSFSRHGQIGRAHV